ncbi:MAG: carboxypeptidase-like regulatory domain-containing protein, partial [Bacteroidales bacterium]|nr:carboxypeptidase-like regulatory domain-containing protein [Bacteroidales bacterium]
MLNKKWSGNKLAFRIAFVFIILLTCLPVSLLATENGSGQPVKVSGVVVDQSNSPLIGVTVLVEGTTSGTTTGQDGSFEIDVPPGSVLVVS